MSSFQISTQALRNGATNTSIIGQALSSHPVHQLCAGDVGHTGVASAVNHFRDAWSRELRLRERGTQHAGRILTAAASDVQRLDTLLALAATRMANAA